MIFPVKDVSLDHHDQWTSSPIQLNFLDRTGQRPTSNTPESGREHPRTISLFAPSRQSTPQDIVFLVCADVTASIRQQNSHFVRDDSVSANDTLGLNSFTSQLADL